MSPFRGARQIQIGVKIDPANERSLKHVAEQAEKAGFHSLWLSERVAVPLDKPHPFEPMADPWIGLAFAAAVTEHVILGTSVSQIALRPPVLMARELATLDRLSAGRLIVGAGAGWVDEEFTSTGVPFETRGGRLNEFVRVLRHLWTMPEQPWRGRFYDIPAAGIIKPARPGGPPIYIGATTSAGLRRAARYGDGFIAVTLPPAKLIPLKERLDEMRAKFGRRDPFAFLTQAEPPASVTEAKAMARDYAASGVDGIILTYRGELPGAFLSKLDVVKALTGS